MIEYLYIKSSGLRGEFTEEWELFSASPVSPLQIIRYNLIGRHEDYPDYKGKPTRGRQYFMLSL
jgi:hypothetical protein